MKLEKIRIKNFRSIKSEVTLEVNNKKVIVGPNNSGKTNLLKAIYIFFNSLERDIYNKNTDIPFGIKNEQTSIIATFTLDENDEEIRIKYIALNKLIESNNEINQDDINNITIYLSFTSTGKASYRIITNERIIPDKRDLSRTFQDEIISNILEKISCNYIPSEKDPTKIYQDFLLPHLKSHIGEMLQSSYQKISDGLSEVSNAINQKINDSGIRNIKCEFDLPNNNFSDLISSFDFFIDDGERTNYLNKGSGIQAATSLSFLYWVNQREVSKGRFVIWLIEEPESYLHPGLIDSCGKILDSISSNSQLILTTHAIGFVPSRHEKTIEANIINGETLIRKFNNYAESTDSIRKSLGLRFSDFYNLSEYNIFVEGKTDKKIIESLLRIIKPKGKSNKFEKIRESTIIEFSGVSKLKDFLKSTYAFMAHERKIVAILDGDDAGKKASTELVSYFSNKNINFRSNKEYILLPKQQPIEGLFPLDWLEELSKLNPTWIKVEKDAFNELSSLVMDDKKKTNITEWLLNKAEAETEKNSGTYVWASNFIKVFAVIEEALNNS